MSELEEECQQIYQYIKDSKHLIAFTGAGISTSIGLPDYRGENGIRTLKRRKTSPNITLLQLEQMAPSVTHMGLYELHQMGYLKHIITQNVDNLHCKSGLDRSCISELHGNLAIARCETCLRLYHHPSIPAHGYCTSTECPSSKRTMEQKLRARTRRNNGRLIHHITRFDQDLDPDHQTTLSDHLAQVDVALILGTSLKVEPFASIATESARHVIIVNHQPTSKKYDQLAKSTGVRSYTSCDTIMERVIQLLLQDDNYQIKPWAGKHQDFPLFHTSSEDEALVNILAGQRSS